MIALPKSLLSHLQCKAFHLNGVQTGLKCKPNVKRCKRFVFAAHSPLLHPNTLTTKAISHFQADHILTRFVFPPLPAGIPSVKGFNSRDIGKLTSPFVTEEDVKVNNDYATSLGAIATVMGSISQMTNEGASAWLTWSANLMTAIGTAIPAIEALIAAKKAESIGNAVASATQTPVVGWLLAGAAVASVIAAFATMPQFANGGVVDGSSFFGDKVLARVNSGEMILNKSQQSNLFNLLDGGSSVKGGAMSGEVEFKISDKALVGVLKQHNNRTNRLR